MQSSTFSPIPFLYSNLRGSTANQSLALINYGIHPPPCPSEPQINLSDFPLSARVDFLSNDFMRKNDGINFVPQTSCYEDSWAYLMLIHLFALSYLMLKLPPGQQMGDLASLLFPGLCMWLKLVTQKNIFWKASCGNLQIMFGELGWFK